MVMSNSMLAYEPIAPPGKAPQQRLRHTLDSLAGKVVGFIDNAKPNFNHLVDDLAELLIRKYGVAEVVKHRKRGQAPLGERSLLACSLPLFRRFNAALGKR